MDSLTADPIKARPAFARWLGTTNDITRTFLAASRIPGLINMAGGLPAPETFPAEAIAEIARSVIAEHPGDTLGYGPIEPFLPGTCPVFIWELQNSAHGVYGFPAIDGPRGGLKIATEQYDHPTTADSVAREVSESEVRAFYERWYRPNNTILVLVGDVTVATSNRLSLRTTFM